MKVRNYLFPNSGLDLVPGRVMSTSYVGLMPIMKLGLMPRVLRLLNCYLVLGYPSST
jgi:hypothetical protein